MQRTNNVKFFLICFTASLILFGTILGVLFLKGQRSMQNQQSETVLSYGIPISYPHLDPTSIVNTANYFVIRCLVGHLVEIGDNNQVYSALAERFEVSEDYKTYRFFLNKLAKFSNGESVTVDAVIKSIKRTALLQGTHVALGPLLLENEKLKTIDSNIAGIGIGAPNEIIIRLNRSEKKLLYWLGMPEFGILHPNDLYNPKDQISLKVTTGPYYIEKRSRNDYTLVANPHYYLQIGDAAKKLNIIGYETLEAAITDLKNKKLDVLEYGAHLDPELGTIFKDPYFAYTDTNSYGLAYFILNPKRNLFASITNRQGFIKNLNPLDLIPFLRDQLFFKTRQFIPPNQNGHLPEVEADRLIKGYSGAIKPGEKITVLYSQVFGERYKQFLQTYLKKTFGFEVIFIEYPGGQTSQYAPKDNYDCLFYLMGAGEKDTAMFLSYHFSGSNPVYRFDISEIQKLYDSLSLKTDEAGRIADFEKINRLILEQSFLAPVFTFKWFIVHRADVMFDQLNNYSFSKDPWTLKWKK